MKMDFTSSKIGVLLVARLTKGVGGGDQFEIGSQVHGGGSKIYGGGGKPGKLPRMVESE